MPYDLDDTIVAIASPAGPALRGIVRVSGPHAAACLEASLTGASGARLALPRRGFPSRLGVRLTTPAFEADGELLYWPGSRSYTRQPSAELHLPGSPPLLAAAVAALCEQGARAALPGEFTLRAFAAGRIDLTQAEGVLAVIDARGGADLESALEQLAGGLSRPLTSLRGELFDLLADLEAGLDFADERIEFVDAPTLRRQLAAAAATVKEIGAQLGARAQSAVAPRIVLVGEPNAGKSSLFNALASRCASSDAAPAIVSSQAGTTRDFVATRLSINGQSCELVDTAGVDEATNADAFFTLAPSADIHSQSQSTSRLQRLRGDLLVHCIPKDVPAEVELFGMAADLIARTKCDLQAARISTQGAGDRSIACSALTGEGVAELAAAIGDRLHDLAEDATTSGFAASTAGRCRDSLAEASRALAAAAELVGSGQEELIAAELRAAIDGLGEILGATCADDILDRVFSRFCIGK